MSARKNPRASWGTSASASWGHPCNNGMKLVTALLALLVAAPATAQSTLRLHGRLDVAQFSHADRRPSGARLGLALAVETAASGSAGRIVVGYAPASESAPGWESVTFEAVPYFVEQPGLISVGLRFTGGAQHITAATAARRRRSCEPDPILCFSDGIPGFGSSWAAILGASAEAIVPVRARWAIGASIGLGYLLGGQNRESRVILWTLGIRYAFE